MFVRTFSILSLSIVVIFQMAEAKPVCASIEACQNLKIKIEDQIQVLARKNIDTKISAAGFKFVLDTSNPKLGEAYMDPSGLVWGSLAKQNGEIIRMSEDDAESYCEDIGAHLPTEPEFKQLAIYLGRQTASGYSPLIMNSKAELLPELSGTYKSWSASNDRYSDNHLVFYGHTGELIFSFNRSIQLAVRCAMWK